MLHLHRWRWRVSRYYTDTSWNDRAPSTEMVARCERCGKVKHKHLYGVIVPHYGER